MGKILTAITVACLLAGCASPQTQVTSEQIQVASATQQTCTRETPIGSNIPVTKCRSAEQMARDAEAARDAMSRPMPVLGAGGVSR